MESFADYLSFRIVRPSHALPDHPLVEAVTKGLLVAAASEEVSVELLLLVVVDRSLSTMFVSYSTLLSRPTVAIVNVIISSYLILLAGKT